MVKTATTTSITGAGTSTFGQAVQLTATVTPAAATGTVQFMDGSTSLGTVALSGGSAAITFSSPAVGTHPITTVYSGDSSYAASTSAVATQTVQKAAVAVTLSSSVNPSFTGQAVVFTATLSMNTASGTVQFLDGTTVIITGTVRNRIADTAMGALPSGGHSVTAVYSGDDNYNGSTSAAVTQTVKTASSTTISSDMPSPVFGQTINLVSAVTPSAATGTIQFLDGVNPLGTASVSGGTQRCRSRPSPRAATRSPRSTAVTRITDPAPPFP